MQSISPLSVGFPGGGAVYHDLGNLNFTFILDAKDATDLDIRLFCQPIAELLRSLNVPAEVNGRNDISIEGKNSPAIPSI